MNICTWCNTSVADDKTIWIRKNLVIGYPFCSNKCSAQWKNNKDNVSKSNSKLNQEVVEPDIFKTRGDDELDGDAANFYNPQVVFQQAPKSTEEILAEAEMMRVESIKSKNGEASRS